MITRGDILLLGISSGVTGGLIGGLLLGIGLNLVVAGVNIGWLLLLPAAPISGVSAGSWRGVWPGRRNGR